MRELADAALPRLVRLVPSHLAPLQLVASGNGNGPMASEATLLDEAGAAAIIVGTAIGGGFLATPHATAPSGALPSAAMLSACWLVLLVEASLIADLRETSAEPEAPLIPSSPTDMP